jgi:pimeloyl-ACP methyl ester carboxylesterase
MANKFKSWFIRTGGIKSHFIEAGEGDPLILIHGGGPGASGEHNWGNNIEALARHFRVFALDLIGYGLTEKPAIEYSYQAKVDQLASFMDTLCMDKVFLGGNSMGSYVVVRYALDRPERVKKVIMVATATVAGALGVGKVSEQGNTARVKVGDKPDRETMRAWLEMLLFNKDRITDELLDGRVRLACLPGAVEAQNSYRNYMRRIANEPSLQQWYDISQRLPKVTFPLALFWGKDDCFAPVELAYRIRDALPNLKGFYLVENSGHQVQNDQPEKFNQLVIDFLQAN